MPQVRLRIGRTALLVADATERNNFNFPSCIYLLKTSSRYRLQSVRRSIRLAQGSVHFPRVWYRKALDLRLFCLLLWQDARVGRHYMRGFFEMIEHTFCGSWRKMVAPFFLTMAAFGGALLVAFA